jgi:peptidoglycan/LPS O-acetylase OafA/YrhL
MRGIAALVVFAVHVWIYQLPNTVVLRRDSWEKTLLFEGRVAFVMFFVLSGYLLYRAFARAALGGSDPVSVPTYFARRAARIVPAYYVALAGALLLLSTTGDTPGRRPVDGGHLPLFLVFGQNYSPHTLLKLNAATWTLAVEVAFYLLLPLIGLAALRLGAARSRVSPLRRQMFLLVGLIGAGLAWNLAGWLAGWGPVAAHSPPSFLPYFACGMLVALAVEQRRASGVPPLGRRRTAQVVAAAAALLVANGVWHGLDRTPDGLAIEVLADIGAAVAFAAVIAAAAMGTGSGLRWIGCAPLAWMGTIAYGFYLWHIPVLVFARAHGLLPGGVLSGMVVLPFALALGAASWYVVERPAMRWAGRLPRLASSATSARYGRSRSRSPARTERPPASLSARAGAGPR